MQAHIRVYEELNDFLAPDRKKKEFVISFDIRTTVRQLIKLLRIPVSTVDLVLANGKSVGLSHVLRNEERISLYPVFELLDVGPFQRVRVRPLRRTRFAVGPGLMRVATYLRLFGFDVVQVDREGSMDLKKFVAREKRILLKTNDRKQEHDGIARILHIQRSNPFHQFLEVVERLDLWRSLAPCTRCVYCNRSLYRQEKNRISVIKNELRGAFPCCHACQERHLEIGTKNPIL